MAGMANYGSYGGAASYDNGALRDAISMASRIGDMSSAEALYQGRMDPVRYIGEYAYRDPAHRAPWENPYKPMATYYPPPAEPKKTVPKFKANKKLLLTK